MPQNAISRPAREAHAGDEFRSDPVHDAIRLARRDSIERTVGSGKPMQLALDCGERLIVETCSDPSGVDQPALLVAIAEHQRSHRRPALQRSESADDERLHAHALNLQPVAGTAASVSRSPALRDDAFELEPTAVAQKFGSISDDVIDELNSAARIAGEQISEDRFPLFQFDLAEIPTLEMEQIENVINERAGLLSAQRLAEARKNC